MLECRLNQLLDRYYQQFLVQHSTITSIELSSFYVRFSLENKVLIQQLIDNHLTQLLLTAYKLYIQKMKLKLMDETTSIDFIAYKATFVAYGLVGIISQWFTEQDLTEEELQKLVIQLIDEQFSTQL